jgi:hypothetical protein
VTPCVAACVATGKLCRQRKHIVSPCVDRGVTCLPVDNSYYELFHISTAMMP